MEGIGWWMNLYILQLEIKENTVEFLNLFRDFRSFLFSVVQGQLTEAKLQEVIENMRYTDLFTDIPALINKQCFS